VEGDAQEDKKEEYIEIIGLLEKEQGVPRPV